MATDNKYDRQLRLWGSEGQKKLAYSKILLVNPSPAGTNLTLVLFTYLSTRY
jgi:NEDD8-activating enzyme E1 regulatory subunit